MVQSAIPSLSQDSCSRLQQFHHPQRCGRFKTWVNLLLHSSKTKKTKLQSLTMKLSQGHSNICTFQTRASPWCPLLLSFFLKKIFCRFFLFFWGKSFLKLLLVYQGLGVGSWEGGGGSVAMLFFFLPIPKIRRLYSDFWLRSSLAAITEQFNCFLHRCIRLALVHRVILFLELMYVFIYFFTQVVSDYCTTGSLIFLFFLYE